MKLYVLSLGAGLLVGIVYSLLSVRSPAPPLVALVGLLGILIGEKVIPVSKELLKGTAFGAACEMTQAKDQLHGPQLQGPQLQGRSNTRSTEKEST